MEDCIFCKIINQEIDCFPIYEDEDVIAFLDLFPKSENPGHTLVVPKQHQCYIYEGDFDFDLMKKVNHVARIMQAIFNFNGLKIINNNGELAGQEIKHVHVHLVPYYEDNNPLQGLSVEEVYEYAKSYKNYTSC